MIQVWRPVRDSNPCCRREREAIHCNSMKLRGMDRTLPHLEDSRESLLGDRRIAKRELVGSTDYR